MSIGHVNENILTSQPLSVTKRVASGSTFNLLANSTRVFFVLASAIVASRIMGEQHFGSANILMAYCAFLQPLLSFGFENSLPYFIPRFLLAGNTLAVRSILRGALAMTFALGLSFLVVFAFWLNYELQTHHRDHLIGPAMILVFQTLAYCLSRVFLGFLRGLKEFTPAIIIDQILFPIATLTFFVIGSFLLPDVYAFTASYLCASMLCLGYGAFNTIRALKKLERGEIVTGSPDAAIDLRTSANPGLTIEQAQGTEDIKDYNPKHTRVQRWSGWLVFSLPLGIMMALENLFFWIPVFVTQKFFGAPEVGRITVCLRGTQFVPFLLLALTPIFMPFMSELIKRGDKKQFKELYQVTSYWSAKWSLVLAFFIVLSAPILLSVFNPEYKDAAYCLWFLMPGAIVEGCLGSAKFSLVMLGKNKINVFNFVVACLATFTSGFLLAPHLGINGVALAGSIGMITLNCLRSWQIYRSVGLPPFNARHARNLIVLGGTLFSIGFLVLETSSNLWVRTVSGGVAAAVMMAVIFWKDREIFLGFLEKRRTI